MVIELPQLIHSIALLLDLNRITASLSLILSHTISARSELMHSGTVVNEDVHDVVCLTYSTNLPRRLWRTPPGMGVRLRPSPLCSRVHEAKKGSSVLGLICKNKCSPRH